LLAPANKASADGNCTDLERTSGTCVVAGLTDEEAIIRANQPGAGSGGTGSGGSGGAGAGAGGSGGTAALPAPRARPDFQVISPTLNDLIGFRPTPGVDHMEPNGWFIVGLDANFYATGGSSVQSGTLLGYPASVRFTPIRWAWTYGDGSSATRSTPGRTWQAQGIPEFEPTSTSHIYERAGTYYIDLTLGYRAEYTFDGSGWATIPGMLWLPANRLVATVGGAKTVLFERDCSANPSGAGC
jgi:hypothetical protein